MKSKFSETFSFCYTYWSKVQAVTSESVFVIIRDKTWLLYKEHLNKIILLLRGMFCLISVFAFGEHFMTLLLARSLQGVASACISISGKAVSSQALKSFYIICL